MPLKTETGSNPIQILSKTWVANLPPRPHLPKTKIPPPKALILPPHPLPIPHKPPVTLPPPHQIQIPQSRHLPQTPIQHRLTNPLIHPHPRIIQRQTKQIHEDRPDLKPAAATPKQR